MKIKIIGFGFLILGLVWAFLNEFSCRYVCKECVSQQLYPCYFLFLFVGIIFAISGASLVLTNLKKD